MVKNVNKSVTKLKFISNEFFLKYNVYAHHGMKF